MPNLKELQTMKYELRQMIQRHLWKKGWKKADLAEAAVLYPSDLSNFMKTNGARTIPIDALDAITKVIGLPEGELYPLYIGECYNNGKIIKHRCEEFLYRTAVLGRKALTDKLIANILSENQKNVEVLFAVASRLFGEKRLEEALPLIELVVREDVNRFGQRLATCYFYRFFIIRDKGMELGYQALIQMLEYLTYMPREIQLEAYFRIITFFNAKEDWHFVMEFSKRLEEVAKEGKYYGEALLYQSIAARELGNYAEALQLTDRYALVDEYYANIAEANSYFIYIQEGKTEYVDQLINKAEKRENAFIALPTIIGAYVTAGELDKVPLILERFSKDVDILYKPTNPFMQKLLLLFRYYYSIYLFETENETQALSELLEAAKIAHELSNTDKLKDCLLLYSQYRPALENEKQKKYDMLLREFTSSNRIIWNTR